METKLLYEAPELSVVVLPMEEPICKVSDYPGFGDEEDWG